MDGTLLTGTTANLEVARHLGTLTELRDLEARFATGALDPAGILTPADKVDITEDLRARHGLTPGQCTAYGDSMSDAPLFRHLANTVAVNADHHLADIAALDYRGTDLTEAYTLARTLHPA